MPFFISHCNFMSTLKSCVATLILSLSLVSLAHAQTNANLSEQVRDHLASGEFTPALTLAESAKGESRDQMLADVARAQFTSGTSGPALRTLARIDNDRYRSEMFSSVAEGRFARGTGQEADFESLLELIESTVVPLSWIDAGGVGSAEGFESGVYVDAKGLLKKIIEEDNSAGLQALYQQQSVRRRTGPVARKSHLRKVSLTRLEREIQLRRAQGLPPTETMSVLAGLQRIEYVFVYPKSHEIVIAGPASDWKRDRQGRQVGRESGRPCVRLDDLLVILRHMSTNRDAKFGCSITPTKQGLTNVQKYLSQTAGKSISPTARRKWLANLKNQLGRQDIDVYGIDPKSRAARVIVEADYHMKLVGLGLEKSVAGVPSYLASIHVPKGEAPKPMGVLRWWFTLDYKSLVTTANRNVYQLRGPGVKVLSENELLTEKGERVHTGKSDVLNRQFAHNFTRHFDSLAGEYPVYNELRNIFDLALVAALIQSEGLADRVGWNQTGFGDSRQICTHQGTAPRMVESVINHRVVNRRHIVAAVSGGVSVNPWSLVRRGAISIDKSGSLEPSYTSAKPNQLPEDAWWWD